MTDANGLQSSKIFSYHHNPYLLQYSPRFDLLIINVISFLASLGIQEHLSLA